MKYYKPTQDKNFWKGRIEEGGSVEAGMAVGFHWPTIDKVHKEYIKEYVEPNAKILDAGCGYGRISDWFTNEQYTGVDFLEEFINEAKKRHPNKSFTVSDLSSLPFDDQAFDWAILVSVRVVIRSDPAGEEKWKKVEKELKRVAKQIMILEYGNGIPREINKAFEIL